MFYNCLYSYLFTLLLNKIHGSLAICDKNQDFSRRETSEALQDRRSPIAFGDNFHRSARARARSHTRSKQLRSTHTKLRAFARPAFLEQTPVMGFCKLEQVIPLADHESGCVCGCTRGLYPRASAPRHSFNSRVFVQRHRFTVNLRIFVRKPMRVIPRRSRFKDESWIILTGTLPNTDHDAGSSHFRLLFDNFMAMSGEKYREHFKRRSAEMIPYNWEDDSGQECRKRSM